MLNIRKTFSIVTLFICLFCTNYALGWQWGDDITVSGFDWNNIISQIPFPYVDDADGNKVKLCRTKIVHCFNDNNLDASHVSTKLGTKIPHYHFQDDWGQGNMASASQANAYYDARFESPSVCPRDGNPTNVDNCFAYACRCSFGGTYNYAFDTYYLALFYVLADEAEEQQSTPEAGDILIYPYHATFIYDVEYGYPKEKLWKYGASALYFIDSYCWDTPMAVGQLCEGIPIYQQPWSWSWYGAGWNGYVWTPQSP